MGKSPDLVVVAKTKYRMVAYARDSRGRMPARDFLCLEANRFGAPQLVNSDRPRKQQQTIAKFLQSIAAHVMDSHGLRNEERFKRFKGGVGLCEFKAHPWRILAFEIGTNVYLTHAFNKPQGARRTDRREITLANKIKDATIEWLSSKE